LLRHVGSFTGKLSFTSPLIYSDLRLESILIGENDTVKVCPNQILAVMRFCTLLSIYIYIYIYISYLHMCI